MLDHTRRHRYVIYYGWLADDERGQPNAAALAIAAARPAMLLAFVHTFEPRHRNLSLPVLQLLREHGVRVTPYVTTAYATRAVDSVLAEALEYLDDGVDGIFFDEVYNFLDDAHTDYYRTLSAAVRARGRTVIMNTGIADTGEAIMNLTDLLMVEHQWRTLYERNPWWRRYPADRFIGVSSNEPGARAFLGTTINRTQAIADTREAWANGIGWHTSTDQYIWLPPWFAAYTAAVDTPDSLRLPWRSDAT